MPNLDGGHYFLTVLAPVRTDRLAASGPAGSHRLALAEALALLPTGRQTAASPADAPPPPFAANTQNHFVRLVVIDGLPFNGRNAGDTLVDAATGKAPLDPQPVDRLSTPYLLLAADIDAQAPGDGEAALRAYTDALWATMAADLRAIFGHCIGFDTVGDAATFHGYIKRCQVETTMPFNDYWANGLPVTAAKSSTGWLKLAGVAAASAVAVWLASLLLDGLLTLFGVGGDFAARVAAVVGWGALLVPLALIVVAGIVWLVYRAVLRRGASPFPTAPDSDLPSVLKALFLQQAFTRFAIDAQGASDADLHARFGAFLAATVPGDVAAPTQPPGVVGIGDAA